MTPVAIAVISYLGGALTVWLTRRLGGMSEDYEAASRTHSATINGYPVCPGCGVPQPPHYSVTHYRSCTLYGDPVARLN